MPGGDGLRFISVIAAPVAERLESILSQHGYDPVLAHAASLEELRSLLGGFDARIVFVSPSHAGLNLDDVLKTVREFERSLPVIIVAEPDEEEAAIEGMRAGARDYILTNHLSRLAAVVERELREAEWRRERARFEARLEQRQRLESIGLLAGGVAHDFNNLLTGILGNSSMALDTVPRSSPARKMLSDIIEATERAANLSRRLLAYAGRGSAVSEPLDISDLVDEIGVLLQSSIPPNVRLRKDLQRRLPCVMGDATELQQMIMNLVMNGAEAIGSAPGSVLVTTGVQDVDETYIQQNLRGESVKPGRYVKLEVHDSGPGLDDETRSRIFEPFFTTKPGGRGLGLSAVQGIVRAHKGAIRVHSAPGHGSTFKVLLPATDEETIPFRPAAKTREAAGGHTVLVVDDEEIVRQTAKTALQRFGYRTLLASGGAEAVRIYREQQDEISLVLLDLTMPGLSGQETARDLLLIDPDCAILLSSGYNESEAMRAVGDLKICGFVQKPYTAATLIEKVRECLNPPPPPEGGMPERETRRDGD